MIFLCERNRGKERSTSANLGLVKVLNDHNIQHFKYNTDTHEILYMQNHELRTYSYSITGEALNHTCKIKNIEAMFKQADKPPTDLVKFILARANFKDLEDAQAAFAEYTSTANTKKQKLANLKKQLESGNY